MRILIKNGKIWDGNNFRYGDILTKDKKTIKIAENISDDADFIYDASGKIVSCGLIDIHTHLKGISLDDLSINADMACIPFGVTSAVDASAWMGNCQLLEAYAVKSAVFLCAQINKDTADFSLVEMMRDQFGDKAIGIKVYFDTNCCDVHSCKPLREICDYARQHHYIVMVHCSNSPTSMREILETLNTGDILTHSYHGGLHNAMEDNFESIQKAKERGIIIDVGYAGHVHTNFKVLSAGITQGYLPDVLSTDITRYSAYKRGGRYGLTMCMSIARQFGMREDDVFRCVTSNAARAVRKENEWGFLREGCSADIAVLDCVDEPFCLTDADGNTAASGKSYRCLLTIIDGDILYKH